MMDTTLQTIYRSIRTWVILVILSILCQKRMRTSFAAKMNALTLRHAHTVPSIPANAGENAATKFLEFFAARIRNLNTREAYARACCEFLAWSANHVNDLRLITPTHVPAYIEQHPAPQAIKQHCQPSKCSLITW
jgi:hypothetical protein